MNADRTRGAARRDYRRSSVCAVPRARPGGGAVAQRLGARGADR